MQHASQQALFQHTPLHLYSPGNFLQSLTATPSTFPPHPPVSVAAPTQPSQMQKQQSASPFAAAGAAGGVPFSSPLSAAMVSQAHQHHAAQTSSAPLTTSDPAAFLSSSAAPPVSTNADATQDSSTPLSRDEIVKRRKMVGNAFVVSPDKASPLSAEFVFGGNRLLVGSLFVLRPAFYKREECTQSLCKRNSTQVMFSCSN